MCKCASMQICWSQLHNACTFKRTIWINLLAQRQNNLLTPFFWEGKSKGKPQLKKMWWKNFSAIIFAFECFREKINRFDKIVCRFQGRSLNTANWILLIDKMRDREASQQRFVVSPLPELNWLTWSKIHKGPTNKAFLQLSQKKTFRRRSWNNLFVLNFS